jgi:hypothetical protein
MGDTQLLDFKSMPDQELRRLEVLLRQIVAESRVARQPPENWSMMVRFHVTDEYSPLIVQVREHLMDLLAYRDDAHLSASRPHFNEAGIVWLVLDSLAKGGAVNAEQMAEKLIFRGYEAEDYEIAIQAAVQIGWIQQGDYPNTFCLSQQGRDLRERAEQLTNEIFYTPWSVLTREELDELYGLLIVLRDGLNAYRRSRPSL